MTVKIIRLSNGSYLAKAGKKAVIKPTIYEAAIWAETEVTNNGKQQ